MKHVEQWGVTQEYKEESISAQLFQDRRWSWEAFREARCSTLLLCSVLPWEKPVLCFSWDLEDLEGVLWGWGPFPELEGSLERRDGLTKTPWPAGQRKYTRP